MALRQRQGLISGIQTITAGAAARRAITQGLARGATAAAGAALVPGIGTVVSGILLLGTAAYAGYEALSLYNENVKKAADVAAQTALAGLGRGDVERELAQVGRDLRRISGIANEAARAGNNAQLLGEDGFYAQIRRLESRREELRARLAQIEVQEAEIITGKITLRDTSAGAGSGSSGSAAGDEIHQQMYGRRLQGNYPLR